MADKPEDDEAAPDEWGRLGAFIRSQRRLKELSQRELAKLTDLSDPYVSQIERGLHQPSVRVLKSLANALNVQVETMLVAAGLIDAKHRDSVQLDAETAIRTDPKLTDDQKEALLSVYKSYVSTNSNNLSTTAGSRS
ncbi:MAG: helix-turn-helix domain-containing protein [Actinomycetia bacterium]|nr:helix-turn-helix domain-containing protein [Actinomycetes bacterium]MCP4961492.1 helix-turn-helix domain-containing protein [Actinomycetes bacterium]